MYKHTLRLGGGLMLLAALALAAVSCQGSGPGAPAPGETGGPTPPAEPPGPAVPSPTPGAEIPASLEGLHVSEPHTHQNLSVYLVHGREEVPGQTFLTLQEAMEAQLVTVHETGDVNRLAVENTSATESVFIQAGDIVKGGKQDRVLAVDLILESRSGKVPIDSFCVEAGRWQQRGDEAAGTFGASIKSLSNTELKLAALHSSSQSEVWEKVSAQQASVARNVEGLAQEEMAAESPSSLQLTLENEKVEKAIGDYTAKLGNLLLEQEGVIGVVFAVNGELRSADLYASQVLSRKLYPRLLEASATEAVSELDQEQAPGLPTPGEVEAWLAETDKGSMQVRKAGDRVTIIQRETDEAVRLDTQEPAAGFILHRTYLRKK